MPLKAGLPAPGGRRANRVYPMDFDDLDDLEEDRAARAPVLVCLYGGGLTPDQGRGQLGKFAAAAAEAGFAKTFVLDHFALADGCETFWELLDAMVASVDEDPERAGCPLLIFAHSVGAHYGFGLARRLGDRVLKLYAVADRPPHRGSMMEVWGVDTYTELAKLDDAQLLDRMVGAWHNDFLAMFAGREAGKLPKIAKSAIALVRKQYGSPFMPCGPADIKALADEDPGYFEPVSAPILAIAAERELAKGETPEKMRAWEDLTTGGFSLEVVEGDHFSCLTETESSASEYKQMHDLVLRDMKQFL